MADGPITFVDLGRDATTVDLGAIGPGDLGVDAAESGIGTPDFGLPDLGPDGGPPDLGADLGPDAGPPDLGTDAGTPDLGPPDLGTDAGPPVCHPIAMLDCASGTVAGDTATTGTALVTSYPDCATSYTYPNGAAIYTFSTGSSARQSVTISSSSTATGVDYDLYVLDGSSTVCDGTSMCTGSSTGGTPNESVTFDADPTSAFYVYYDRFTTAPGTITFSLTVACTPLVCGDGVIAPGEDCDDGNTVSADGCSATCTLEPGYSCTGAPSVCGPLCGNGVLDTGEQCDDANAVSADGCTMCVIDPGYACSGTPSVCAVVGCGNGVLEPGETCDDHNMVDGDGCSSTCLAEVFTPTAPSGSSVMVMGSIDATLPTYMRMNADCTTPSGRSVYYQAWVIENTSFAHEVLTITAAWTGDGFLFVYDTPFEASMPPLDCRAGNDDFMGLTGSQLTLVGIDPGQQIVVIATTYGTLAATGPYTLTIATM